MSDNATKPEENVALEAPKATEEVPTTTEATTVPGTQEVSSGTAEANTEETPAEEKKEEKPEPKEITHGTLAKAHGGLLSFFKQKRFFYFQDEPISEDKLKVYLHKDGSSRSTAAYASQTSKGLLLYAKTEGQKEVPHGIIKLADVTEVQPVGTTKFVLKLAAQDLHFESSAAERDSWVFTLNHKINEAKAAFEEITNSEGYKAAFEKLTKPIVTAAAKAPEKTSESAEAETEEVKDSEVKADKDDVTSGAEEESGPADKKVEAPSKKGKRTSVFAFLDKKKKVEDKKDEIVESKEEEQKDEPKITEQEPVTAPAAATEDTTTEVKETLEVDEADKSLEPATASKPTKRNSIFGAFIREKKDKEAEEEKKEDAKAEASEPAEAIATELKPIEVPAEAPAAEKAPESASSPPRQKFLSSFFDKKEKNPVAKAGEKETDTKPTEVATEAPVENIDTAPVVAVDDSGAPDASSPAISPREQKRKSSFFSFKKDKKSEDVKSDSEDTEPALKSGSTSPLPKAGAGFLGLMRKASKSAKHTGKEVENKEVAAPETVAEEPATTAGEVGETAAASAPTVEPTAPTVEDVVPEAINVTQAPVQATT